MQDLVIPAPDRPTLPTSVGGRFPVRRVYCVGRNYAAHAREMGHDPDREPPFFFTKPSSALVTDAADTAYPPGTDQLEHEVELVVALGRSGHDLSVTDALGLVWGYGVGLDLTRRDLQAEAKRLGRPWDLAKGFDASAPIGTLVPAAGVDPTSGAVELRVDGDLRQSGDLADQIWSVAETIAELSRWVALAPGDLLLTGTPDGVGPLQRGDVLDGSIAGVGTVHTRIV
ncbi:fumarylacetoacetate hydrolase family protein [Curtobacterium sp. MCSS17_007]|uniref:fumarylacetoacetate hydrolase family protein n=1 Tax=Curtobacterium sp. MCSS17_007 TaxID=2175646 RepID=UPI000DAAB838|nr:fumarylacetoacetate hydrolase family protein [Curtobacterium sp. MCSS17_007]WIE75955.1 fumarylacetoacetate hydrolase family protein [Curtobacterium sp. MCSS17_007]